MAEKSIVIFGASGSGIAATQHLQCRCKILAYCDNDAGKWGTTLNGIPVIAPNELGTIPFQYIYIASEFFEQIELQLIELGCCEAAQIKNLPASVTKPLHIGKDEKVATITLEILKFLSNALETAKCEYYVDAGTLLGIVRDNALIPWDDDLDFSCDSRSLIHVRDTLEQQLSGLMTLTQTPWTLDVHYANQDFGAVRKGDIRGIKLRPINAVGVLPLVDVFVKYVNGDEMDYVLSSRGIRMPSEHIQNTHTQIFKGFYVRLPSKEKEYLTRHYGDWRTPKQEWDLSMLENATVFTR